MSCTDSTDRPDVLLDAVHRLAGELAEPGEQGGAQACAREHAARIPVELRQYGLAHESTAARAGEVRALAVKLAPVIGHECDADEIAVDETGELAVHVQVHGMFPDPRRKVSGPSVGPASITPATRWRTVILMTTPPGPGASVTRVRKQDRVPLPPFIGRQFSRAAVPVE